MSFGKKKVEKKKATTDDVSAPKSVRVTKTASGKVRRGRQAPGFPGVREPGDPKG